MVSRPCPKCGKTLGVLASTYEYSEDDDSWYLVDKIFCPSCGHRDSDIVVKKIEAPA